MYSSSTSVMAASGWSGAARAQSVPDAQLRLIFAADANRRTYLYRQHAAYPFHVCRVLYPDRDLPEMATIYLQSSSGGIYEDELLGMEIDVQTGGKAHVTTQASTIVHQMTTGQARQDLVLVAGRESLLEYLPDPLILFPGARLHSVVDLALDEGATAILSDAFLTHDPEGKDRPFGLLENELSIRDPGGRLLVRDRFKVSGEQLMSSHAGVAGGHSQVATLVAVTRSLPAATLVEVLRDALASCKEVYAGVSSLPNGCGAWARLLAVDGVPLKAALMSLWSVVRCQVTGAAPAMRRK